MLELFGSGLVALWLNQLELPATFNPWHEANQTFLKSSVGMVIPSSPDLIADRGMTQYLSQLREKGLNQDEQGIWLQSGSTLLAEHRGMIPFPAASLTKVVISLAALETWAIHDRFETVVSTTGSIQNGVLQGDVVVQGGADPLFGWQQAIALGNQLNKLGISRVQGDLVIDGRFVMNFQMNPLTSGRLLKQALNSKDGNRNLQAQYAKLPLGTPHPQVAIAGTVRSVSSSANRTPVPTTERWRQQSLPLYQLLRKMNVYSNNVMAQMLADSLGGHPIAMKKAAAAAGIDPQEIQLVNGSGLGVENRLSARAVCAMLTAIERIAYRHNLTLGDLFPTAGFDIGTLEDRNVPATAVVKTGTLSTVSTLAGVLPTRDRGLVWFTIINRGTDIIDLRNQQDVFLQQIQQQWGKPGSLPIMVLPGSESKPEGYTEEFSEP